MDIEWGGWLISKHCEWLYWRIAGLGGAAAGDREGDSYDGGEAEPLLCVDGVSRGAADCLGLIKRWGYWVKSIHIKWL